MVSFEIASQVAKEELKAFLHSRDGWYGEKAKVLASHSGLREIAESVREKGSGKNNGWEVLDLITGERYFRPSEENMRRMGYVHFDGLSTWSKKYVSDNPSVENGDKGRRWYKENLFDMTVMVWRPSIIAGAL